ncbi:MAG: hypothetical protein J5753_05545 [Oscillospiraceae bacterium]|nr:hypothetical protein [Oscillospiraceae bacterium]
MIEIRGGCDAASFLYLAPPARPGRSKYQKPPDSIQTAFRFYHFLFHQKQFNALSDYRRLDEDEANNAEDAKGILVFLL